jgi:hypothetical protein
MRELFGFASIIKNILKDLIHGYNGYSEVNSEALSKFIGENVRGAEENNFGLLGPTANEATILIQEALL